MALYELVLIARPDVSSSEVDKIVEDTKDLITEYKGSVVKTEYWGMRALAYPIGGAERAHYYFLGFEGTNPLLKELDRRTKLNERVLRHSVVRVEAISANPSPILTDGSENSDIEEVEDVTASKK